MADLTRKSLEDIRSWQQREEVQYVLGNPPSWIIKWGISFIAVGVFFCLTIGWVIEYPDTVAGQVRLYRERPPVAIVAPGGAQLQQLFVQDEQVIDSGAVLASFDPATNVKEVLAMEQFIEKLANVEGYYEWSVVSLPGWQQLGGLLPYYLGVQEQCKAFQYWIRQNRAAQQLALLEQQANSIKASQATLSIEQQTLKEVLGLAQKEYDRQQALYESGTISASTREEANKDFLEYVQQTERIRLQIEQAKQQEAQLRLEGLQLQLQLERDYQQYTRGVQEQLQQLRRELQQWKAKNLLLAPVAGRISMPQVWSQQQYFKNDQVLLSVIPPNDQDRIIGLIELPLRGSGKVLPGMDVRIRLDNFPAQEFGDIKGTIKSIAATPIDKNEEEAYILARVELPRKLKTTYEREIIFFQEMRGQASIITENRTVLERIFDKVLGAVARV